MRFGTLWTIFLLCCTSHRYEDWANRPFSIKVEVRDGPMGTQLSPLDPSQPYVFKVDAEVLSAAGTALPKWSGWVRVSARPGKLTVLPGPHAVGNDVFVQDGRASDIPVRLEAAFGPTVIWVEDVGFTPQPFGTTAACNDGVDNDGDGAVDMFDPGCFSSDDGSEEEGSYASGVSAPIWFQNPTIATVQGRGTSDPSVSPYIGETVTIDRGMMIVTRITRDGMYVSDIADNEGFNHIFVYSFNTPAGVRVCDRLKSLSGIVGEFYKFTELNFPTWTLDPWYPSKGPCLVPEPKVLSASDLADKKIMESLEAALARVEDVLVGDNIVNCDYDGNGNVDYRNYNTNYCSAECQCREKCEADPLCTEWSQYKQYRQWAVAIGGEKGAKLFVVSEDTVPDFDPFSKNHPKRIRSITGTLRNISFLKPAWILEPRCPDDLVVSGQPRPTSESCIWPRTGPEEEPNG